MTNWYHILTRPFGYPQPENNFDYIHKTYDTSNACLTCNLGLKQINEFRVRSEPKSKHSQFLGLHWVFDVVFVRPIVKDIFEREKITGVEFSHPVINKTGLPVPDLFQLRVNGLLNEGLITDNLNFEICELPKDEKQLKFLTAIQSKLVEGPFCGQKKYNLPQGDNCLIIKEEALKSKPDFVRLDYHFGSGGSANRPIIISEKVKQIIDREKWRGAFLQPIKLV